MADRSQRQLDEARRDLEAIERQRDDKSNELNELSAAVAGALAVLQEREEELKAFRVKHERLSGTRIDGLRDGLTRIADSKNLDDGTIVGLTLIAEGAIAKARLTLEADDALVVATSSEFLAELSSQRDTASTEHSRLRDRANAAELALERLKLQVFDASHREARLTRDVSEDRARRQEFNRRSIDLRAQIAKLQTEAQEHDEHSSSLKLEADKLKPLAAKLIVLDKAYTTLASLEQSLATETARKTTAAARIIEIDSKDTLAKPHPLEFLQGNVDMARTDLRSAEEWHRTSLEVLATTRLTWERQQATAAERANLTSQVASLELELSDWTRLAADLGKNGIQAAEIDGALDELNVLVNDLLHECHSSRWTMRLDTQRVSGDGKRMIETLDVVILDTESGREGKAETFSGGERAILGEALALALTMVACRRAGLERPTLVRDESGAALDPANARAYVAMLRRAAKYVEASCVLVVSHQPDIAELCDARIEVTTGQRVAEAAE
jgi:DNA repair exonuclease SbcCD ATPase subunit